MSERFVLDASALLALLQDEPGAARVQGALPFASISSVNLAEVVSKLADAKLRRASIDEILEPLDLDVVPFDREQAMGAGLMRPATRAFGLSLGDRACLALALATDAKVLTADTSWAAADVGCGIEFVR